MGYIHKCFICSNYLDKYLTLPINLINQSMFQKQCECDGFVHKSCLVQCLYIEEKCPLCSRNVLVYNYLEEVDQTGICYKILKYSIIMISILFMLLLLYLSLYYLNLYIGTDNDNKTSSKNS
jgi:hypothetical protein